MKKIITSITLIILGLSVYAQEFQVRSKTSKVWGKASDFEVVAHNSVRNLGATADFTWKRMSQNFPSQWKAAICDNVACWDVTVERNTITIGANDSSLIDFHFYPYGQTGFGTENVLIWKGDDSLNADTIKFELNAVGTSVNNVKDNNQLTLYPNPAKNTLNLNFESKNQNVKVEIYDVLGNVIIKHRHSQPVSGINISDLPNGLYVLRVFDGDKSYSRTFKKVL